MRLPNLFLIGAPKAATTSLASAMAQHPDVGLPAIKEPDYFCWDEEYRRGLGHLSRAHYESMSTPVRVDASVTYLASPAVPERIARDLDEEHHRFIVVLRDPVDRAYSNYWECRKAGFERHSFEEAVAEDATRIGRYWAGRYPQSHLEASRYGSHLTRWLASFPRERFLFLRFEDVRTNPNSVLRAIYTFAAVDADRGPTELPFENRASNPRWSAVSIVSRAPEPVKVLGRRVLGQRVSNSVVKTLDRVVIDDKAIPPMDQGLRRRLRDSFRDEMEIAGRLTGLTLEDWR